MFHGLTESVGARVSVFPDDVSLLPDENGFNVAPSTLTSVAVSRRQWERLPAPYETECTRGWEDTPFAEYEIASRSRYTMAVRRSNNNKNYHHSSSSSINNKKWPLQQ